MCASGVFSVWRSLCVLVSYLSHQEYFERSAQIRLLMTEWTCMTVYVCLTQMTKNGSEKRENNQWDIASCSCFLYSKLRQDNLATRGQKIAYFPAINWFCTYSIKNHCNSWTEWPIDTKNGQGRQYRLMFNNVN